MSASAVSESLRELVERGCPICGSTDDGDVFADQRLDLDALDENAFASRKRPEHMRLRLVRCPACDLVYASPLPSPQALAGLYEAAAFTSSEEARYAARSYAAELEVLLPELPNLVGALDI